MSRTTMRRALLAIPIMLATLVACTDTQTTAPKLRSQAHFAQGENGIWTVNTLSDHDDGSCDDIDCTLREAIATASSGGQVVFAAGLVGTIPLTAGHLAIIDKDLSVHGDKRIVVDAQRAGRVLAIHQEDGVRPAVTLTGLTLKNGLAGLNGGGIHMSGRELTMDNVILEGNEAPDAGGGIYLIDADATIRNSTIRGNKASAGGGMYVANRSISVFTSTLDGNSGGGGGGIWNVGTLSLMSSTLSGNSSTGSGGGILNGGRTTVVNSVIQDNDASTGTGIGGGIYNTGELSITGSTVSTNRAFNGGGIATADLSTSTIGRSTISGNLAASLSAPFAGGIASNGQLTLISTTIAKNNQAGLTMGGATTAINTVIVGNDVACDNLGGGMVSIGHNLSDFNPGCGFDKASDVAIPFGQGFQLVLESDLKDNGGPTKTHALLSRGRAVDAGYCPGETADQRGFTRPVDDPTMPNALDACDIGAYEAQGPQIAVADLMVSQSVDKGSAKQGEFVTYTVRVQNLGPQTAPNVVLANVLSSGVTFVEVRVNRGTTTAPPLGETGTVTWNLTDMPNAANEFAEIKVKVLVKGKTTITNTATVAGDVADPNPANNAAAISVTVGAGGSGGGPKKR